MSLALVASTYILCRRKRVYQGAQRGGWVGGGAALLDRGAVHEMQSELHFQRAAPFPRSWPPRAANARREAVLRLG